MLYPLSYEGSTVAPGSVGDRVASFAGAATRKDISLRRTDRRAPPVVTDPERLRRILENLVKAGALDWTGESRASMSARLEQVVASASSAQRSRHCVWVNSAATRFCRVCHNRLPPTVTDGRPAASAS